MPTFGESVAPIEGAAPLGSITPGTQEWINARMAAIIEQLRRQYGDAAARRGVLQSGSAEEEFADAVAEQERQVQREAGEYTAQVASREDTQDHERQIAREQARAQEKAAMWGGVGQAAPYALFGKWGSGDKTLAGSLWDSMKGSGPMSAPAAAPSAPSVLNAPSQLSSNSMMRGGGMPSSGRIAAENVMGGKQGLASATQNAMGGAPAAAGGVWDKLKSSWEGGGAKYGLAGTGLGMALNSKNALGAGLAGGAATFGNAMSGTSGWKNFALPALAGSMIQTKGKVLKGDNLWKNLIAAGAVGASFM